MITVSGIRNTLLCGVAFTIVACASTPMPVERSSIERAEQAPAAQFAENEFNSARSMIAAARSSRSPASP